MNQLREIKLPDPNGGLNTKDPQNLIENNQSPDLMNLWYKDKCLSKRPGQELFLELTGAEIISPLFNGTHYIYANGNLYNWAGDVIKETVAKGFFIEFGSGLYYIDGTNIYNISTTVTAVTPYEPVVMINAAPDRSSSDDNESYNLIGAGFTVKYNGDNTATAYSLPQTSLDATAVKVSIGGVTKTEGTHFTVNRTAGTVNFAAGTSPHGAPATGTNNVWITAYKTVTGNKPKIAKCTIGVTFGGESTGVVSGTRAFFMGNPDYPFHYWASDLGGQGYGITYFPDTSEEVLDQNAEKITAAAKMRNELVIFKESSIFAVGYAFDGVDAYFPVRECHSSIGCDVPKSVQLIDNQLVFCNSKNGVYILISTSNDLENIVKPLSANINALLLKEADLDDAVSTDWGQYYWLCVNGNAYLWDYGSSPYYNYSAYEKAQRRLAWYRFDNINANDFYSGFDLYYASDTGIVKFKKTKNDFGQPIKAWFKSKAFDIGAPDTLKTFDRIYVSFARDGYVKAVMRVGNEEDDSFYSNEDEVFEAKSFSWNNFRWDDFTWGVTKFSSTFPVRIRMKKSVYIQVELISDQLNRGLGFAGMTITFMPLNKIKR